MIKKIEELSLNSVEWLAEKYIKSPSGFLIGTSVVCFASLPLLQVASIKVSKKIPEDQKKYLIPQTMAEGILNAVILLSTSNVFKSLGTMIVKRNIISPNILPASIQNIKCLQKIVEAKVFDSDLLKGVIKNHNLLEKAMFDKFKSFQAGMEIFTGPLLGLVASTSMIIPIISNKYAQRFKPNNDANDIKMSIIPAVKTYTITPQRLTAQYNGFKQSTFTNFSSSSKI